MTGRYFQDWLLLESDWNWRLQPDRGGALRAVGDIGSHWLDLMTFVTGQHVTRGHGRSVDVHRDASRANGPGRDVLDGPLHGVARARDLDRGHGVHPAPLRGRRSWRGEHQPDQPWPEEFTGVRDRRLRRRLGMGLRAAGPGVGRTSRAPQRDPDPQPGADGSRPDRPPRRCRPATSRGSSTPSALTSGPSTRTWSPGRPPPAPAIPRSRTATTRCSSATRSREAPARVAGSRSTAPGRPPLPTPSPRNPSDEARSADRALPRDAAHGGRRLDGRQRLRKHRDRLLAPLDRARPGGMPGRPTSTSPT